jgi:hypothetical protein
VGDGPVSRRLRTFVEREWQQHLLEDQTRGLRLRGAALKLHDKQLPLSARLDRLEAAVRAELKATGVEPGVPRVAWVGPRPEDCFWKSGPGFDMLDVLEAIEQVRAALASGSAEAGALAGYVLAGRLGRVGRDIGLQDRHVGAKCREGAPRGGREREPEEEERERWARWRAKADAMRRDKPTYSENRIAKLIAEAEGASQATVREVLRGRRGKG